MGVVAAEGARKPEDYAGPTVIRNFNSWLVAKGYEMYGYQLWNSNWDNKNGKQVSSAILA